MNELTVIKSRADLAQIPEVQAALNTVEKSVLNATLEKPVSEFSSAEIAKDLNNGIKFILLDIGCRISDEAERRYIVLRTAEMLKKYYPRLTLKEFRLAFEMCVTGQLDMYLPKDKFGQPDRNHYQQFNLDYICKVLNAYKKYRSGVIGKAYEAEPKPEKKFNDEYYRQRAREDCYDAWLYYKYHNRLKEDNAYYAVTARVYLGVLNCVGLAEIPNIGGTIDDTMSRAKVLRNRLKNAFDGIIEKELQLKQILL